MALFRYKARGPRGDAIEGTQEAASAEAVAGRLIEGGLVPIDIEAADERPAGSRDLRDLFPGRVGLADLILFSRQMYSLIRAGVPMLTALNGLAATTRNRALAHALGEVVQMLEAGHDLATALSHQPGVFSDFYVSMVRVGETSGQLEDIFQQLTYYLEREKKTRDQVRAAVRYPLFVLVMITIAIGIINVFVIPAFAPSCHWPRAWSSGCPTSPSTTGICCWAAWPAACSACACTSPPRTAVIAGTGPCCACR